MFTFTLAALALCAGDATEAPEQRPYHEINADIRDAMRRESTAKSDADQVQAIRDLCALYEEVTHDPRLMETTNFEKFKITLWSRLTRVKKELEQIEAIKARREGRKPKSDEELLVEQYADSLTSAAAAQIELSAYSLGGPARLFSDAGASGGGAVGDYGPALIDLISRTIEPDFWDVNGGPGSMFYYAPLHALVVRATSETHREIGIALEALRAAGP